MKKFEFKSLRTRLTFWFLILTLIPLMFVIIFNYMQGVKVIESRTFDKLTTIRDLKVDRLKSWLSEREGDMIVMSSDDELTILESLIDKLSYNQNDTAILVNGRELLNRYIENYEAYNELFIINSQDGKILLSTNSFIEGEDKSTDECFTKPMQSGEMSIKDIYFSKSKSEYTMTYSIPIFSKGDASRQIIGILVAQIDLKNSLYKMLLNRVGLGETGETLIVNKDVVAMNELRWEENAPLNLKINTRSANNAARGQTGILTTIDYRHEPILAAYTYITETEWGFVVKQDLYELNEPIRAMLVNFLIIFLITALIIALTANMISKSISKPIVEINKVAKKIGSGDFSVRNIYSSADEIGSLASEFNNMANLIESRVETQKGVANISETMIAPFSMKEFGTQLLKQLMETTDANMSAFYILNETTSEYEHFTSVGVNEKVLNSFSAENPEGEVGNAISTKRIYYLRDIPENTIFKYKSISGDISPKEIIIIPILTENTVVAIISLINIKKFSEECYDILEQSWTAINVSYENLMAGERTRIFADQLSISNQQLEAQTEELQQQAEEMQEQAQELQLTSEELQEQNLKLDEQKKQLESANKLKSEFLSNMSHELRTPLNSIMALSRVLLIQAKDKLSDEENSYLEIIERNGKNLLSLINDILDLSKIEAGKMETMTSTISIGAIARMVKESMQSLAVEKVLKLNLKVADNLPKVETDEVKFHQALLNIVSNAVKFTEKGNVDILVEQSSEDIIVKVKDSGIGISEEMLSHVFDEFRQVDGTSSRKYEGTGLGLSIASKLLLVLGGNISVQSELGKGSVFTITVPIKWYGGDYLPKKIDKDDTFEDVPSKEMDIVMKNPKDISETSILIVEDNKDAIIQIRAVLESEGYQVMIAENGREALDFIKHTIPDGIILDLMMPDVDGFEVLDNLRGSVEIRNIPVLVLTAKDLSMKELSKLKSNNIKHLIYKGDVDIESMLSKVKLMIGYVKEPEVKKVTKKVKKKKPGSNIKLPKLLVVEDNADNMITIKAILGSNFIVSEAVNGEQGLMIAQSQTFDMILLGMSLPKLDGKYLVSILKNEKSTSNMPIIAVTALAMKGDKEKFLKLGCDGYVSKPIEPMLLMAEIERLLS